MHSVCGGVEKFGTGIPKMLNACKAGGNPEPEYRIYEKSISLVLKPSEKYMLLVDQLYGRNMTLSKIQMSGRMMCYCSKNHQKVLGFGVMQYLI